MKKINKEITHCITVVKLFALIMFFFINFVSTAFSFEIKTSYSSIIYEEETLLDKFDNKIYMGRLRFYMPKDIKNLKEKVASKVDLITHKVQSVLEMYPKNLQFEIYILRNTEAVREAYYQIYKKKSSFVAFYSPKMNAVFVSPEKMKIRILAHEIGHVVVENYFEISPPVKIHEVLAQFSERNLGN